MAIRLFVHASPSIRASASVRGLRVVAPAFQKPSVSVSKATYQVLADFSLLQASIGYQRLHSSVYFRNAAAVNVILDPDTKNRYFRIEPVSISELAALSVSKTFADQYSFTDSQALQVGKALVETASVVDVAHILLVIQRSFSDTIGSADAATVTFGKSLAETLSASDAASRFVGKGLFDVASVSESKRISFGRPVNDSYSVSDNLQRIVSYTRDFDDVAEATDISYALFGKSLVDSTGLDDVFARVVSYNPLFEDAPVISDEALAFDVGTTLVDAASMSDLFDRTVSYARGASDTVSMLSDIRPDIDTGLGKEDSLFAADGTVLDIAKGQSDAAVLADQTSLLFERPLTEAFSTADVFSRAVQFSRSFADFVSLDDNATIGGVEKTTNAVKTNIVAMVEEHQYAFGKTLSNAFSVAEVTSRAVDKTLTDSMSIGESIFIEKRSVASSVLNASALNAVPLNN